jgi:hypothetical protein
MATDNLAEALAAQTLILYRPPGYRKLHYAHLLEVGATALKSPGFDTLERSEQIARVARGILKEANRLGANADPPWQAAGEFARLLVEDFFYGRCGGSLSALTHKLESLAEGVEFVCREQAGTRPGPKVGPRERRYAGEHYGGPRRKLTTTVSEGSYAWLASQGAPAGEVIDRLITAAQERRTAGDGS